MAAGCKSGRFTVAGATSVDTLVGDVSTYNYMCFRRVGGTIKIGGAALTADNGFSLFQGEETRINAATITGAETFVIGPGVVEFFGHATA